MIKQKYKSPIRVSLMAWLPVCLGLLASIGKLSAANPIIPGYADPQMRVWGGKMYIAAGKDKGPEIKSFVMPYWSIFSSTDLVNWTKETTIDPKDTYLGPGYIGCWATDITSRNGKYYFYFSNQNKATGVLSADRPSGPWRDVLKKPLLGDGISNRHEYDPTVFDDDDGKHYLIYGRDGLLEGKIIHYQIRRLNDDMISFAEEPKDLLTDQQYGFGDTTHARDHNYFHKHGGLYYLSCGDAYMTSANIYGPYSNLRAAGQPGGHSSYVEYNGQWYHAYENTCDPFKNRLYRQVMLTYLHYKANGDMLDDPFFLKNHPGYALGVGNYDALWDRIEAEWFFEKSGGVKAESPQGGFEIQEIMNGDYLTFPNVNNLKADTTVQFRVSAANSSGAAIEVRADSSTGPLLGSCKIAGTGSWKEYQTVSCPLKHPAGTRTLILVFKGGKGDLLHLDWLSFNPK